MGRRKSPYAEAARALIVRLQRGERFTPPEDAPPCRHCEVSPAFENFVWGLCYGCARDGRVRAVYQHRAGWSADWEDWLMLLRARIQAGEAMEQPGDKPPPLPLGYAGRGKHSKRGRTRDRDYNLWTDSKRLIHANRGRKRWNGQPLFEWR